MNTDQTALDIVDLGVASEETKGLASGTGESFGRQKQMGISDDD